VRKEEGGKEEAKGSSGEWREKKEETVVVLLISLPLSSRNRGGKKGKCRLPKSGTEKEGRGKGGKAPFSPSYILSIHYLEKRREKG